MAKANNKVTNKAAVVGVAERLEQAVPTVQRVHFPDRIPDLSTSSAEPKYFFVVPTVDTQIEIDGAMAVIRHASGRVLKAPFSFVLYEQANI